MYKSGSIEVPTNALCFSAESLVQQSCMCTVGMYTTYNMLLIHLYVSGSSPQ